MRKESDSIYSNKSLSSSDLNTNKDNNYYHNYNGSNNKTNKIIELTNKSNERKNKDNIIDENNEEIEYDDILEKFHKSQLNKEQKNYNKKGNFKREPAYSTVRHQIKDKFSLNKLGKIKWAKEHASANRPMNKLKEFTKSTIFCNCCNLPCATPDIIQPFSSCEKSENFSICGRAVPLYFYFIKYCIYCLLIVLIILIILVIYILKKK